MTNLDLIFFSH